MKTDIHTSKIINTSCLNLSKNYTIGSDHLFLSVIVVNQPLFLQQRNILFLGPLGSTIPDTIMKMSIQVKSTIPDTLVIILIMWLRVT